MVLPVHCIKHVPYGPLPLLQVNLLFGETKEQLDEKTEVLEVTELKLDCVTATLDATKKVCVIKANCP